MRCSLLSRSIAVATLAGLTAACSDKPTAPKQSQSQQAAQELEQLASSAMSGGDPMTALSLQSAAQTLRTTGQMSTITLSIDGKTSTFNAMGGRTVYAFTTCPTLSASNTGYTPPPDWCKSLPSLVSLIAWETAPPQRVLTVSSELGTGLIGYPTLAPTGFRATYASAMLYDSSRRLLRATLGTIKNSVTTGTGSCFPVGARVPTGVTCTPANFTFELDLQMAPVASLLSTNTRPAPTSNIRIPLTMTSQTVAGTVITLTSYPTLTR